MDHNRFDRLSQTLADTSRQSRRGVLAALGVALLGTFAGIEAEAASAKGTSRKHSKGKRRHHATSRQHETRGQLTASGAASSQSFCKRNGVGATCQAATCTGGTTLRPDCTCDGQGQCLCPSAAVCPNHLACQDGACLTRCLDTNDCASGYGCAEDGTCRKACSSDVDCKRGLGETCGKDGLCAQRPQFTCDCSNLNDCSGHGVCTETCTCLCDKGWSGSACTDLPATSCGDSTGCETCQGHLEEGCTWCLATIDGAVGVCTRGDLCIAPQEVCPSGN